MAAEHHDGEITGYGQAGTLRGRPNSDGVRQLGQEYNGRLALTEARQQRLGRPPNFGDMEDQLCALPFGCRSQSTGQSSQSTRFLCA